MVRVNFKPLRKKVHSYSRNVGRLPMFLSSLRVSYYAARSSIRMLQYSLVIPYRTNLSHFVVSSTSKHQ